MKKKVSLLDPDALASVSEEDGSNTVNEVNSTNKEHNGKLFSGLYVALDSIFSVIRLNLIAHCDLYFDIVRCL